MASLATRGKLDFLWFTQLKSFSFMKQSSGCTLRGPVIVGNRAAVLCGGNDPAQLADCFILLSSTQRAKSAGVLESSGL